MSSFGYAPTGSEELNNRDPDPADVSTTEQNVEQYLEKVKITEEEKNYCIAKFNAEMDPSQPFSTCAACGIADFDLIIETRSIDELGLLMVSPERLQRIQACTEMFRTVYTVWSPPAAPETKYHLHPDFVQDANSIPLCKPCANAISAGRISKYSYAAFDPGRLSVLPNIFSGNSFQPLSPLERIAVARAICFQTVVKLVSPTRRANNNARLPALKVLSLLSRLFFLTALTFFLSGSCDHIFSQWKPTDCRQASATGFCQSHQVGVHWTPSSV